MTAPADPQPATTGQPATSSDAARAFWNRLSRGEQLLFAGAAALVVIGDWVLGALLNTSGVEFAVSIAAAELALLVAVRSMRPSIAWPIPFSVIVIGLATVIVVPAISDLLYAVRGLGGNNAGDMVAQVFDWACAAAVAVGAWMVWHDDRA
jgi:hypothetical protein